MTIKDYLSTHDAKQIRVGASGADVYDLGDHILKHIVRSRLENDLFDTYKREALFYKDKASSCDYLPLIKDLQTGDDEILIVMRKYGQLDRHKLDDALLSKIASVLARIHCEELPSFIDASAEKAEPLGEEELQACVDGWKSVLAEHPSCFDDSALSGIASEINDLISWHDTEARVMVHGDFHFDNILCDTEGRLIVCDWQGVKTGQASSDLSFFMSRLSADGISFDPMKLIKLYVDAVSATSGIELDPSSIVRHIDAANVITTFRYWHFFLHGNPEDRVREVYEKMTGDFGRLRQ